MDVRTGLKVRTSLRSPPSGADDAPPPERRPRPLSLPGEIDLKVWAATSTEDRSRPKTRIRRGGKVVEDVPGVRSCGGAPDSGELRDVRTVLKVRTSLRSPSTTARLHPGGLQQRPGSLSLPGESAEFLFSGEITQNFKQDQSRRKTGIRRTRQGGKVIRDAAGVRSGGGAPSSWPDGGERRDVRTLRTVRTSAPHRFIESGSREDLLKLLK
ncbi:hypothetical protein ACLB2K_046507 [Fragaria x ananassa]